MLFRKRKGEEISQSLGAITWKRFRRNKTGMAGLLIIFISVVIAACGYLITPDKTPFANDQKPELHILEPGTKVHLLRIRRDQPASEPTLFHTLLWGKPDQYQSVPVVSWKFQPPFLVTEEYTGSTPNDGEITYYNMADVAFALDKNKPIQFDSLSGTFTFFELGANSPTTVNSRELEATIINSHLPEKKFLLGTDLLGRDLLSRLMIGTRISLTVGLISVIISLVIGILLGALAGYYRGFTDTFISWLINVVWSIPTLLLVIAITLVLGKGITQVFIAVGLTMWVDVARIVRGQVLSIREKEFVEAGRALGYSNMRIIFNHILPNIMGPVIVIASGNFASAILMEAGLSFLGIGAQPPTPSWGEMINAHRGYILMDKAYLAFIPGFAIMSLVLAFMMVGNALRDAMDTRMSDEPAVGV